MLNAYLDIIFFAIIAVFIAYKLHNVLGRKDFNDPPKGKRKSPMDNMADILSFPDNEGPIIEAEAQDVPKPLSALHASLDPSIQKVIETIQEKDATFDVDSFVGGAQKAFEMILTAFAQGDLKTLESLLSEDVLGDFVQEIGTREKHKETLEATLISIVSAEILEAVLLNHQAQITLKFVSEQINVVRNATGEVVDGDPSHIDQIEDIWTFGRDIRSSNPNWKLIATSSVN